ncbi:TetR/AcrR family transcriptional regulator [Streptococcus tangpeifui]|uniref:TetR/AcrR family transcriptional regulator n=1 Tax=Streptococcus tangpeifui TaxID=2709400 RepID=UPI0013E9C29D|nr:MULTISPECIES: TetR/AcrR family transcriptional regulator [unclassified Streptococcus]
MAQKRQTETKNYLKKALIRLLSEKDFETITISDLTKTAGINRGTFYLHYLDKYDMVNQMKEEMLTQLFNILLQEDLDEDPRPVIKEVLDYLVRDFDFVSVIAKTSYVNFSQIIKDFVFQLIISYPNWKKTIAQHYDIPEDYALEVYLASSESLITYWINQGADKSTADMADIIVKVLFVDEPI